MNASAGARDPFPATEPATDGCVDAAGERLAAAAAAAAAVQAAACAFRACTSTLWGPQLTLWGWLLPGPYRFALPNPAWVAICPAVLPFPYSFVWFDDAGATVLWLVTLDGLTPVCAGAVVVTETDA